MNIKKYNKYGETAIVTLKRYNADKILRTLWNTVAEELFDSRTSQNKGCPRSTFLGLCEEGLVKGVSKGNYKSNSTINKNHGIEAVDFLKKNKIEFISSKDLWSKLNVSGKSHNSQMDVVLALWYENLIVK